MSEETDKFVVEMLKRTKQQQQAKPQTRYGNVDRKDIENITENLQKNTRDKKKKV